MYDIYIGKQRSVVFPIMCNSHILLNYSENIPDINSTPSDTTDDIPYGLWAHEGSFTLEAIITPYDINGMGNAGLRGRSAMQTGDRIMPQGGTGKLSEEYLSVANRYGHEMCLFHNDNFRITLVNATTNNNNQPAEYKIKVYLTIDGTQETFLSDIVISAGNNRIWKLGDAHTNYNYSGFNQDGRIIYDSVAALTSQYTAGTSPAVLNLNTHSTRTNAETFYEQQKIFIRDGFTFTEIGTIKTSGVGSSSITLNSAYNQTIANASEIYVETLKEPTYVDNMHHIAVSFNSTNNSVLIFYNRKLVLSAEHTKKSAFSFARTNCLLGQCSEIDNGASANMQYMGEIHELSIERKAKKDIVFTNTLFPEMDETLLYLRFEEVDE